MKSFSRQYVCDRYFLSSGGGFPVIVSAQPAPSGFESDSVVCSSTNRNNGRTSWDAKDEIIGRRNCQEMSSGGHRSPTAFILWPFSPSKKSPLDPPSPWSWLGAYVVPARLYFRSPYFTISTVVDNHCDLPWFSNSSVYIFSKTLNM